MAFYPLQLKTLEKYKRTPVATSIADVCKFILIYIVISAVVLGFFSVYVHASYEARGDIDSYNDYTFEEALNNSLEREKNDETITQSLSTISKLMPLIPIWLSFFAVFFSMPPKPFKQIALTASILLCLYIPFLYGLNPKAIIEQVGAFCMCVMVPWLLSLYSYKKSKN